MTLETLIEMSAVHDSLLLKQYVLYITFVWPDAVIDSEGRRLDWLQHSLKDLDNKTTCYVLIAF